MLSATCSLLGGVLAQDISRVPGDRTQSNWLHAVAQGRRRSEVRNLVNLLGESAVVLRHCRANGGRCVTGYLPSTVSHEFLARQIEEAECGGFGPRIHA